MNAEKINALKKSPLATELDDAQCAGLASLLTLRSLGDGEILLHEGHADANLYGVISGHLVVTRDTGGGNWVGLHILNAGDLAGELGFIDGQARTATLRATGTTEVFSLNRVEFEALVATQPLLVYRVMRAIIRTVHAIVGRMNVQHVEMTNYINRQHGKY